MSSEELQLEALLCLKPACLPAVLRSTVIKLAAQTRAMVLRHVVLYFNPIGDFLAICRCGFSIEKHV